MFSDTVHNLPCICLLGWWYTGRFCRAKMKDSTYGDSGESQTQGASDCMIRYGKSSVWLNAATLHAMLFESILWKGVSASPVWPFPCDVLSHCMRSLEDFSWYQWISLGHNAVSRETNKNCHRWLYCKSPLAGYWVKFSTSNNHVSGNLHWLWYCHCAKTDWHWDPVPIESFRRLWADRWCPVCHLNGGRKQMP